VVRAIIMNTSMRESQAKAALVVGGVKIDQGYIIK